MNRGVKKERLTHLGISYCIAKYKNIILIIKAKIMGSPKTPYTKLSIILKSASPILIISHPPPFQGHPSEHERK